MRIEKFPKMLSLQQLQKKIKTESVGGDDEIVHHPGSPSSGSPKLSADIVDYLFSFLPIKEAVQAGTVSRRFEKSWHLNRMLLFGSDFMGFDQQQLVDVIEKVFRLNKSVEIQAFCLHINPEGIEDLIQNWLGLCFIRRVKDLELRFSQPFLLESHFLDSKTLETLRLYNCEIQLPETLTGLKFLNTLVLKRLQLSEHQLETLIANCKLLRTLDLSECLGIRVMDICARENKNFETLKIAYCHSLEDVNIDAPSLRSIFYRGVVIRIQFERALPLKEAFFQFLPTRGYLLTYKVDRLVVDLFYVAVLTITCAFIEPLAPRMRDGQYREAAFCLPALRELQIFMEGGIFCNPHDIAVFLKSCPTLEILFIDLNNYNFECGLYWKLNEKPMLDKFAYEFRCLRFVKLVGFRFAEYEIELVKVLLQKSVSLEAMVFVLPENPRTRLPRPEEAAFYNQLFRSWIVSPRARLFVYENGNDKTLSPTHPKIDPAA